MYLIIGLGNPGKEYVATRHNIGFEVINKLAYDHKIEINKLKFKACIGEGFINGKKVILVKPQTFMNLSGNSISQLIDFYKPIENEMIIIYDDIALSLEEIRIREKGSAGGHNGIKSIISSINSDEFLRIRVGVGEKPKNWDLADYVLSKFKNEELDLIKEGITKASDSIEMILSKGLNEAKNKFNKKIKTPEQIEQKIRKQELRESKALLKKAEAILKENNISSE